MKKINQKIIELEAELENCKKEIEDLKLENDELYQSHLVIHSALKETIAIKEQLMYVVHDVLIEKENCCLDNQEERNQIASSIVYAISKILISNKLKE